MKKRYRIGRYNQRRLDVFLLIFQLYFEEIDFDIILQRDINAISIYKYELLTNNLTVLSFCRLYAIKRIRTVLK